MSRKFKNLLDRIMNVEISIYNKGIGKNLSKQFDSHGISR